MAPISEKILRQLTVFGAQNAGFLRQAKHRLPSKGRMGSLPT
jgi:hypothetical protein